MVVTGDQTQIDLPKGVKSGLKEVKNYMVSKELILCN